MRIFQKLLLLGVFVVLPLLFTTSVAFAQQSKKTFSTPKPTLVTPTPTPTPPAIVNSYEVFWPITAGRVMGDSMYSIKSLKESVREWMMFGSFKKAEYNTTLAEKRLVEAEYLLVTKKDYENAKKSLGASRIKIEKALGLIQKLNGTSNVGVLKSRFITSLEKQRKLVDYLSSQVSEDPKKLLEEHKTVINSALDLLK